MQTAITAPAARQSVRLVLKRRTLRTVLASTATMSHEPAERDPPLRTIEDQNPILSPALSAKLWVASVPMSNRAACSKSNLP